LLGREAENIQKGEEEGS